MSSSVVNLVFLSVFLIFYSCNIHRSISSDHDFKIEYLLAGSVTHNSADLIIKANKRGTIKIKLLESNSGTIVYNTTMTISDSLDFVLKHSISNLKSQTLYTYQVQPATNASMLGGRFTTFTDKPFSYKIAFGSCLETGSKSDIFLKIKQENPLFFMITGDLHYENIDYNCTPRFYKAYKKTFTSPQQAEAYRSTPLVYLWDDHDFGPNNADGSNPCLKEARAAYTSHIPHYPLTFYDETGPISQTFNAGRVQYVLTDLRSQKVRPVFNDCERIKPGTNFGSEDHLNWFFSTLLKAKNDGKVVAWVSSYSYINAPGGVNYICTESDNWGGYPEERKRIANFIKDNKIPLFILSGDAHMVAIDDGRHSDYATKGGAPIRVFHAGAIDSDGSYKGGPYSEGYSITPGQYGVMEVTDVGSNQICFKWYGKNKTGQIVKNGQGKEIGLDFCVALPVIK